MQLLTETSIAVLSGDVLQIAGGKLEYLFNYCSNGGECTTKLEKFVYDWWPGYKLGTCINNGTCTAKDLSFASGDAAFAFVGGTGAKGVKFLGGELVEAASEKYALDIARRIEKELGPNARRMFHDLDHLVDRTKDQLKSDAREIYEDAGKDIPKWLR